uniref:Helicase-associated domain-containing protein n=1 Tax=viral metagenome TaxID=1070528 RepID=A0A6C0J4C0_9ZZZZ
MKDILIRKEWGEFIEKYTTFFMSNEKIWFDNKRKVEDYIKEYNILPSKIDKNKEIKSLGNWISSQKQNYKNKHSIMKDPYIIKEWQDFTEKYSIY